MVEKYTKILDEVCDPLTVQKFTDLSSLSRNEAISVLEKYIQMKGEPVWALYEVSGVVDSSEYQYLPTGEKMTKHVVVPGSSLEETKKKFSEVFSARLHSIQRTNPKETRVYGRSWADNDDLKGKDLPKQEKPKKTVESSPVKVKKEKSVEPEQKPSTSSFLKAPAEAKKSTIVPPKKQANIASMFSKKVEKPSEIKEKSVSPPPPEQEKKVRKRPKVEVDESEEPLETVEEKQKTPEKKASRRSDDFPSSREQSVEKEKSPPRKRQKKSVNDENTKAKKRLIVPDSDEEMVEEQTPMEVEEKKEEKPKKSEERRRTTRIEKVVETYVDEDGYLVSKEVQKAVECSPQKSSPEKPKAKVITAPVPGVAKAPKKNATITSFFKKA